MNNASIGHKKSKGYKTQFCRLKTQAERYEERNKERGKVPKAVHCASQSKDKESRVRPNHTPSVPLPNLDHQTAEPTLIMVLFFSQFCRFGSKTLLLIEFFFYWVGSDLIHFCFGFLESLSKCLFSQFQIFAFVLVFQITKITKNIVFSLGTFVSNVNKIFGIK